MKTQTQPDPSDSPAQLTSPWRDITSFSQSKNENNRIPRTWEAQYGPFNLVLTRHIDCAPDQWTAVCYGVFTEQVVASKNVKEAACQAQAMLQMELQNTIQAIIETKNQTTSS